MKTLSDVHADRIPIAEALGKIQDRRAVEPLIAALKDKYPPLRRSVAAALGAIKDRRAVEPLIAVVMERQNKDSDLTVIEAAVRALGEIRDPRAVEPLVPLVVHYDYSPDLYEAAAEALKKLGATETQVGEIRVRTLLPVLKDSNAAGREAAVVALGESRDPARSDH